jgi:hypothetical protein
MKNGVLKSGLGALALLCSSVSMAATVTVSGPHQLFTGLFQLLVTATGMPPNNGATLGLTWDATKVRITSLALASGTPFDTLTPTTISGNTGSLTFTAARSAADTVCLDVPGFAVDPCDFPVIVINGMVTTDTYVGPTNIRLVDDHTLNCWVDALSTGCFATSPTYVQPNFFLNEPLPAAAWLFGSGLGLLGLLRRRMTG